MVLKNLPLISFIIPAKPEEDPSLALAAVSRVNYPSKKIEVILVRGYSPSGQRNQAAKRAQGEILYFLDSDSEINADAPRRVAAALEGKRAGGAYKIRGFSILPTFACRLIEKIFFADRKSRREVGAVGGPNVWEGEESFWSSVGGIVFESFFADLKMCSRFRPIGDFRRASEKELILCNLALKKRLFLKLGGFREELYPNEENELLNRFSLAGYDCVYHPGIYVIKPRRKSFLKILRAFFGYGRGRMEQVRIEGLKWGSPLLLPLMLLFYLVVLIFYHPLFAFAPIAFYLALGFSSAVGFAVRRKKPYLGVLLPFIFLIIHLSYAVGTLFGVATDLELKKKLGRKKAITLERIKNFDQRFAKKPS